MLRIAPIARPVARPRGSSRRASRKVRPKNQRAPSIRNFHLAPPPNVPQFYTRKMARGTRARLTHTSLIRSIANPAGHREGVQLRHRVRSLRGTTHAPLRRAEHARRDPSARLSNRRHRHRRGQRLFRQPSRRAAKRNPRDARKARRGRVRRRRSPPPRAARRRRPLRSSRAG